MSKNNSTLRPKSSKNQNFASNILICKEILSAFACYANCHFTVNHEGRVSQNLIFFRKFGLKISITIFLSKMTFNFLLEDINSFHVRYKLENDRSTPGCLTLQSSIRQSLLRRLAHTGEISTQVACTAACVQGTLVNVKEKYVFVQAIKRGHGYGCVNVCGYHWTNLQ